jgi:hypothetical protein
MFVHVEYVFEVDSEDKDEFIENFEELMNIEQEEFENYGSSYGNSNVECQYSNCEIITQKKADKIMKG